MAQQASYSRTGRLRHSFHLGPGWSQANTNTNTQANSTTVSYLDNYWLCNSSTGRRSYSVSNEFSHSNDEQFQQHDNFSDKQRQLSHHNSLHLNNSNLSKPLTPLNRRHQSELIEQRRPTNLVCLSDHNNTNHSRIETNFNNLNTRRNTNQKTRRPTSLNLTSSLTNSPVSPFSTKNTEKNYNYNNHNIINNRQSQSARSSLKRAHPIKQYSDSLLERELAREDQLSTFHFNKPTITASAAVQSDRVVPTGLQPSRFAVTAVNYNAHLANQPQNELVEIIDTYTHSGVSTANSAVAVNSTLQNSQPTHTGTQSTTQQQQPPPPSQSQSHNNHQLLTSQLSNKSNHLVHSNSTKTNEEINKQTIKETTQHHRPTKHRSSEGNIISTNNSSLDTSDQGDIELAYSLKDRDKYRDCTTNTNGIVFRSDRGSIHRNNSRKSTAGAVDKLPNLTAEQQTKQQTNRSGLVSSNILPGSGINSSSGYSSASRLYKTNLDNELLPSRSVDASAEDLLLDDEEIGELNLYFLLLFKLIEFIFSFS